MGPPSSGGIAIVQILGMLQRFPSSQLQPGTLSEAHLFTQASRLAYADRAKYVGDTAFVQVPIAGLLDKDYIASRAALIDPAKDMGTAQAGNPPQKHADYAPQRSPVLHGTSHMTIVDKSGEVIAMTTSVESVFGAEVMVKGFFLNNTLTDFSFEPVLDGKPVANAPAAGQAAAVGHVAHHRVRQGRQVPAVGGIARRPGHHRLCRPDPDRHAGRRHDPGPGHRPAPPAQPERTDPAGEIARQ